MKLQILFILCISFFVDLAEVHAGKELNVTMLKGIYVGQHLTAIDKKAVKHLQEGMKKFYDIHLPLLKSRLDATGTSQALIILGRDAALNTNRLTKEELDEVAPDGYVIRSDKNGVVIAGPDAWGTQYGVYHFLEKLGMRFFLPRFNKAYVPKKKLATLPFFSMATKPAFSYRTGRSAVWRQMYYQLGDPRNGLNPELFDPKKTGSDLWIDHSAGYLVPKLMYYDTHPEYYALQGGERVSSEKFTDHRTPLCLSNADVVKISTERALGWIEREPDKRFFLITYGDTGVWCQCDECRKLDVRNGSYSDRLLSWVNPIAKAVKEKYPARTLLTFAYGGTGVPPASEKPEDNVWIIGSTGLAGISFWDHTIEQKKLPGHNIAKIDSWLQVVPDRYLVCEYHSNTYKPAMVETMSARLKYYQEIGLRGIAFTYGWPKNFSTLWKYLLSKLMWDPYQDGMVLAKDFITYYYGSASEHIWRIFEISHGRYLNTLQNKSVLKDYYPVGFYSKAFTTEALASFSKAAAAVDENIKLKAEINKEESHFIQDWMLHPLYKKVDDDAENLIVTQLERLLALTDDSDKDKMAFIRSVHKLALQVEPDYPGTLGIIENWLNRQKLYKPRFIKLPDGIRLIPESFIYSGFGPARYSNKCPSKNAVGVYVKGNSKQRSHRMTAEFELDTIDDSVEMKLTLEGQVSAEHPISPKILIRLNDQEIYSGSADFVTRNWSLQSFSIPIGILTSGSNKIEIINISNPLSIIRWNQRWVLISDAVIQPM